MNFNRVNHQFRFLVASRCEDQFMKDFQESEYNEACYYADRQVARKYNILYREFNKVLEQDEANPIILIIPAFSAEYLVYVNGKELIKANPGKEDSESYSLHNSLDKLLFQYEGKKKDDQITIIYLANPSLEDYNDQDLVPVIPKKYEEEQLKYAIQFIAQKGIVKFKEDKEQKYRKLLQLFGDTQVKMEYTENVQFPIIRPFRFP